MARTKYTPRRGESTFRSWRQVRFYGTERDSRKRAEELEEESDENPDESAEGDTDDTICDPNYYFEDGSVTLRVHRVLFKVHASLFKIHSEDFFNELNPLQAPIGGTTITIPDVRPSQFRNFMKLIYCLPSNDVVFGENKSVVAKFEYYLDVTILSRKFAMDTIQRWSEKELSDLVHRLGKNISEQFGGFYMGTMSSGNGHYLGDYDGDLPVVKYFSFRFVEGIQYARAVSHFSLLYNMLSISQHHFSNHNNITSILEYFRIADLRETDPSLFGFFFLLLLYHGNQVWVDKRFTQEERLALFSAQSFLTPLPQSLKESILPLLFTRPTSSNEFVEILMEDPKRETSCHKEIFSLWQKTFPASYYYDVNRDFSTSIKALTKLPMYRLEFSLGLHQTRCQACRKTILGKLDKDMQEVFTRLGGYYKVFE